MNIQRQYGKTTRSTLDQRRKILSRSSQAGNPAINIRKRLRSDAEHTSGFFLAHFIDDWSNYKAWTLLGLVMFGVFSGAWFNRWAGTVDGAYQPPQVASEYDIVTTEGVSSARG